MAERDNTLVTVHLDQARPYRDRDTMIVTTVGPGEVTIPAYVAYRWGLESEPAPLAEPWPGFADLPVDVVRSRLRALSPEQREAVRAYETANKERRGVLNVLDALEEEQAAVDVVAGTEG